MVMVVDVEDALNDAEPSPRPYSSPGTASTHHHRAARSNRRLRLSPLVLSEWRAGRVSDDERADGDGDGNGEHGLNDCEKRSWEIRDGGIECLR
jgi:hypothetical protein